MFQIANRRRRGVSVGSGDLDNTPFGKWKKLMSTLPTGKSVEDTPKFEDPAKPDVVGKTDSHSRAKGWPSAALQPHKTLIYLEF